MVERDLYLVNVLADLGEVTLGEFVEALKDLDVPTTTRELSNWLRVPVSSGYVEQVGSPGGPRFGGEGYRYHVTAKGRKFIKRELEMVEDMLSEPSTPEPGIMNTTKDKEQRKDKKEPSLTRFVGGSLLVCLSFLAFYAGFDPRFRGLLEGWWTKQVGGQKPEEIPPETPQGLTV